ncbi:MAG: ABC transporter permease [Anaerolineae bacterium]|jgi:putative ABC transport system permease protein
MNLLESVAVALRSLATNKMRAGLTMLGIIIGISAVITLVSVGQGVQAVVDEQMEGIGSNLLFVMPGELEASRTSVQSMLRSVNISTLTLGDAVAMANPLNAPDLLGVAPEFVANGTVVYGNRNAQTSVAGVTPSYPDVRNFYPVKGSFIREEDIRSRARVAALGQSALEELFPPGIDPIGQTIKINRVPFRVIGVMQEKGVSSFSDDNDIVFIPLTTAQTRLFSGRDLSGEYTVSVIYAKAVDESRLDGARDQIANLLRRRHGMIYSTDKNDFTVLTQKDVGDVLQSLTTILTVFLGLIAAVSLLVGGIGIMNIMLVSVTERTREIGIRKAVGAKRRDILIQFLIEAMVLSLLGGLIGITLGVSGTIGVSETVSELTLHLSASTILLSAGFSTGVGLFFGIYPAVRASRLNPIDALRYE